MTDDEVREAQRTLTQYVSVVVRIYDRLESEGKHWPTVKEAALMMAEDGLIDNTPVEAGDADMQQPIY